MLVVYSLCFSSGRSFKYWKLFAHQLEHRDKFSSVLASRPEGYDEELAILGRTFIQDREMSRRSSLADHIVKMGLLDMGYYDSWLNVASQPVLVKVWMHILSEKRLSGARIPKHLGLATSASELSAMVAKRVGQRWVLRVLSPTGNWELPIELGDKAEKLSALCIGPYSSVWVWSDGIQLDTRPSCRWQSLDRSIEKPTGDLFAMAGTTIKVPWISKRMAIIANGASYYLLTTDSLKSISFKSSPISWTSLPNDQVRVKLNNGDVMVVDIDGQVVANKDAIALDVDQQLLLRKFPTFRDKTFRVVGQHRYATNKGVAVEVSVNSKRYIVVGFRSKLGVSDFVDVAIEVGTDTVYVSDSDPRIVFLDTPKRLCVVDGITGVVLMRSSDPVKKIVKCEWEHDVVWSNTDLPGSFSAHSISPW